MQARKYTLSKVTVNEMCRRGFAITCVISILLGIGIGEAAGSSQRATQKKPAPRKSTPAPRKASPKAEEPAQNLSPEEALDRARNAATPQERISLLEKFVSANRGSTLESQARELLIRELALKGEQALRERSPIGFSVSIFFRCRWL